MLMETDRSIVHPAKTYSTPFGVTRFGVHDGEANHLLCAIYAIEEESSSMNSAPLPSR